MNQNQNNKYTQMQQSQYDAEASIWSISNPNPVVGSFHEHNQWKDYNDYLFKDIANTKDRVALDFGCGPGRNIVKFWNQFQRIDGVDISSTNLENAKKYLEHNQMDSNSIHLFHCNGKDLSCIEKDESYDIIFSTICLQHICVHEIRLNYFKEFFRLLKKSGGTLCIQMGFGPKTARKNSVGYFENYYDAHGTNGHCDTRVEDAEKELKYDLEKIGFIDFRYHVRPTGPGDGHPNWIFFQAKKP
jgi:ubiquinone/menaquinone biosynthesis C-methylase UbiE